MDNRFHHIAHRWNQFFQRKTKGSRQNFKAIRESKLLRKFFPIAKLITAIILGVAANEQAQSTSIDDWLRKTIPETAVWQHALSTRGYRELSNLSEIHRVVRSLPQSFDTKNHVWSTTDFKWVAIFHDPKMMDNPILFGPPDLNQKPSEWKSVGPGWQGYQTLIQKIDRAHPSGLIAIPVKKASKPRIYRHPKEIRY